MNHDEIRSPPRIDIDYGNLAFGQTRVQSIADSAYDDPWQARRKRDENEPYRLPPKIIKAYLQENPELNYSDSDIKEYFQRKRDYLVDRIHSLLVDVALMHQEGTLLENEWPVDELKSDDTQYPSWMDFWKDMVDVEFFGKIARDELPPILGTDYIPVRDRPYSYYTHKNEIRFGYAIGHMIRMLRSTVDQKKGSEDILLGFFIAFIEQPHDSFIDQPSDMLSDEHELVKEVLSDLEKRYSWRKKSIKRLESMDLTMGIDFEEIEAGIKQAGITPTGFVTVEVEAHYRETGIIHDESPTKKQAEDITNELIRQTPLEKIDMLHNQLIEDIEALDQGVIGVENARTVLEDHWEADSNTVSPGSVSSNIHKTQVSQIFNKLKNDDDSELWTEYGLTTRTSNGDWRLTSYGKLIAYTCFERSSPEWIYRYALDTQKLNLSERKLITDAIFDIDLDSLELKDPH